MRCKTAAVNATKVKAALAGFKDPETGRSVVEMGQVHDIQVEAKRLRVTLGLTTLFRTALAGNS